MKTAVSKILPFAVVLLTSAVAIAQNASSQVVSVGDGDTMRVDMGGTKETIRMACIDAPEKAQAPYGKAASERLKQLLPKGKAVQVREIERDRYGRMVAEVFVGDRSVNLQMVKEGQAVVYRRYLNGCAANKEQYLKAEEQAKEKNLGFWNQDNPVMPWDFRRSRRV